MWPQWSQRAGGGSPILPGGLCRGTTVTLKARSGRSELECIQDLSSHANRAVLPSPSCQSHQFSPSL